MKKGNKDYKSKWDADEILFKVSVTEVFVLNGKEVMCSDNNGEKNKLYECRMELVAPSKAVAGALFSYAVDYVKHHNLQSENYFRIVLYRMSDGSTIKSRVARGMLDRSEYNSMLHNDYKAFADKNYVTELNRPIFYDKGEVKRDYDDISDDEKKEIADEYQRFSEKDILKRHSITKASLDEILVNYGTDILWR